MQEPTNGTTVHNQTGGKEPHQQNNGGQSLFDRIEQPSLSKEQKRQIILLEREMLAVELEQRTCLFSLFFLFAFLFLSFEFTSLFGSVTLLKR
jgi:hypothetical protein